MGVTLIQHAEVAGSGSVSFSGNVTAGNILLIFAGGYLNGGLPPTLSAGDSQSNFYNLAETQSNTESSDGETVAGWYATATTTGPCTVTVTSSTGVMKGLSISEWSGAGIITAATNLSTGTNINGGGSTHQSPLGFAVGATIAAVASGTTISSAGGATSLLNTGDPDTPPSFSAEYLASTGITQLTWTQTASAPWASVTIYLDVVPSSTGSIVASSPSSKQSFLSSGKQSSLSAVNSSSLPSISPSSIRSLPSTPSISPIPASSLSASPSPSFLSSSSSKAALSPSSPAKATSSSSSPSSPSAKQSISPSPSFRPSTSSSSKPPGPQTFSAVFGTPGTYIWTAPWGVVSPVTVEVIGPGGKGGASKGPVEGGGGGGAGGDGIAFVPVVQGNQFVVIVGGNGSSTPSSFGGMIQGNAGTNGQNSDGFGDGGAGRNRGNSNRQQPGNRHGDLYRWAWRQRSLYWHDRGRRRRPKNIERAKRLSRRRGRNRRGQRRNVRDEWSGRQSSRRRRRRRRSFGEWRFRGRRTCNHYLDAGFSRFHFKRHVSTNVFSQQCEDYFADCQPLALFVKVSVVRFSVPFLFSVRSRY